MSEMSDTQDGQDGRGTEISLLLHWPPAEARKMIETDLVTLAALKGAFDCVTDNKYASYS